MNRKVLVVGIARSGISAAKFCKQLGDQVTLYDSKSKETFAVLLQELEKYDFNYIFGEVNESELLGFDLLVMSPGVPMDIPMIKKAQIHGIKIIGEIELAYLACQANIIAITGTNGKTTTTTLVGEILKEFNPSTYVVGNIGIPFTDVVDEITKDSCVVAEISSFQLETIKTFHPKVSAILNLTEDHLNRHKTFENYVNMKLRITENQTSEDVCVLNEDDFNCRELAKSIRSRILWFSYKHEVEGAFYQNGKVFLNIDGIKEEIIDMKHVKIFGPHNVENIMAATIMCYTVGVPIEIIRRVVETFKGVAHRIEYVDEIDGVKYYNDSKATNPDSAIKGIQAMVSPTILLAGGMDKDSQFDDWIQAFDGKVKWLILYGETKLIIQETAKRNGFHSTKIVDDLREATLLAHELACAQDCVLLSPACASWDMFKDFEERGKLFKDIVCELK